jgi:type I restriction enzyme S subunit
MSEAVKNTSLGGLGRYKPYPNYRDSGVEWLGEIPAHWEVARTDSFLRFEKIQVDPSAIADDLVFHYSIPAWQETGDGRLEPPSGIDSAKLRIIGKRLLVSKLNPRKGVVLLASERDVLTVCSSEFVPLDVQGCDARWAFYLFASESIRQRLSASVRSATRSHQRAEVSDIVKMWHGVPSQVAEQRTIAAFLDRETARIDALVAKKERLIELLQEKRTVVITQAVTNGIDPNALLEDSGVEWLGEIPAHWEVEKWRYCCRVTEGQVAPDDDCYRDRIMIAPNHIESGTGRILSMETADEQAATSGKYLVKAGDIIYSKIRPALNKACIATGDWLCSADMYPVAITRKDVTSKYLLYYILSEPFVRLMNDESMRVAMPKVNREKLAACPIVLPPSAEQDAIVSFLDRDTARIDALVAKIRTAIERLKELCTALITAAVTGKIDVRDAV